MPAGLCTQLLDLVGAVPGEKFTVTCDTSMAGWGEAKFDVVFRGRSLPHTVQDAGPGLSYVTFFPQEKGKHRIYVYYNGIEVKGKVITPVFKVFARIIPPNVTERMTWRFEQL